MGLAENLARVRADVARASGQAGLARPVSLLAVTKNRPAGEVGRLIALGQESIGENRIQEWLEKSRALPGFTGWHIIGTLQRNKVRHVAGRVALIESVDSPSLLEEIGKRALWAGGRQDVLLQVNITGEASKHGFAPDHLEECLGFLAGVAGVRLRGLMTMAPASRDEARARTAFENARFLFDALAQKTSIYDNIKFDILSMGMSSDFETAIHAGATQVRVGRALFAQTEGE